MIDLSWCDHAWRYWSDVGLLPAVLKCFEMFFAVFSRLWGSSVVSHDMLSIFQVSMSLFSVFRVYMFPMSHSFESGKGNPSGPVGHRPQSRHGIVWASWSHAFEGWKGRKGGKIRGIDCIDFHSFYSPIWCANICRGAPLLSADLQRKDFWSPESCHHRITARSWRSWWWVCRPSIALGCSKAAFLCRKPLPIRVFFSWRGLTPLPARHSEQTGAMAYKRIRVSKLAT